ncbi:unnamed protein product [Cuscuta campestris]|uniref:Reverse transcriptase domain-containing protein n=1 Tax=Cuscuta campestris TaxID=132261 RepID=A0A484LTC4_9ASTE|nr:unnamed protein product [Cuscuta campestris]
MKSGHSTGNCTKTKGDPPKDASMQKQPSLQPAPPANPPVDEACRARWRKQHIHSIKNKQGTFVTSFQDISQAGVDFFTDLYSADSPGDMEPILQNIPKIVKDIQNDKLCSLPTSEEINSAVWHLDPNSCAGPDGYNGTFYRETRDIIHEDVTSAAQEFFLSIIPPKDMRKANIVLIPKKDIAESFADYRPISLTNFSSKIISRILVSRLTNLLPDIISEEQGGFIPGTDISDHILLAREFFHILDRKTTGGNLALKLDNSKAFDKISWAYIEQCFSRSLNNLYALGQLSRFNTGRVNTVNHLTFADDVLIFTNGSLPNLKKIKLFLSQFELATGLQLNLEKSQLISPKPQSNEAKRQKNCLGMQLAKPPITYLGVPLYKGINRASYCHDLLKKFDDKLSSWKMHTLSQAGKLTLIKHETRPFLLGGTGGDRKHAWVAWKDLCKPQEHGGLGIQNIHILQQSFGIKLWWKYHFKPSLWSSFTKQNYHRQGAFTSNIIDSPTWKRICHANAFGEANSELKDGSLFRNLGKLGSYSIKEVSHILQEPSPSLLTAQIPWPKKGIPMANLFLWKVTNHATPFPNNLRKLGYNLPSSCLFCGQAEESDLHCLMLCPKASRIWNYLGSTLDLPTITNSSLNHNLIMWLLSSSPSDPLFNLKRILPTIITWELWKAYNKIKWTESSFNEDKTLEHIKLSLNDWSLAHKGTPVHANRGGRGKIHRLIRWIPPDPYSYKLNVDGSSSINGCGGGAVLRDHNGKFIHAISFPLPKGTSLSTETLAMLTAINYYNMSALTVETDCMDLIKLLMEAPSSNAIKFIKDKTQQLNLRLSHTLREANNAADF